MSQLQDYPLEYKIAPPKSLYIIGSKSINVEGDIYTLSANSIGKRENMRRKRCLDVVVALFLWLIAPCTIWFMSDRRAYFTHIWEVFAGRKTWVGYDMEAGDPLSLPSLKEGILTTTTSLKNSELKKETRSQLNGIYAKDYKLRNDLHIIIKNFRKIGNADV